MTTTFTIFTITISILTGSAAIIKLISFFRFRKTIKLTKGQTVLQRGITIQFKNANGYLLSVVCNRGTDGINKTFDLQNDTVSYEYFFNGKNNILTANFNEKNQIIKVQLTRS